MLEAEITLLIRKKPIEGCRTLYCMKSNYAEAGKKDRREVSQLAAAPSPPAFI
ncbi:MAG: hypothetical protein GX463_06725 [Methanothrix sp.]|jgi:hypothetical protein|nr:hypothetical protein [Methanothrix sp.]